ncbi:hypothetical protein ACTFIY_011395 [Dictyostelium cf. discoideum]
MDKLFQSVFNNIYISRLIFNYSRLYKKNEVVRFEDRETLLNYTEREFIRKIVYYGIELKIGDLPNNGVLKEISFRSINQRSISGKDVPFGVEVIEFNGLSGNLNEYPSTLSKVIQLIIPDDDVKFEIPANITSLSIRCYKPLKQVSKYLPNSIKELEFENNYKIYDCFYQDFEEYDEDEEDNEINNNSNSNNNSNNSKIILPNNLIKLSLGKYNIKYLKEGVLPKTIEQFEISTCKSKNVFDNVNGDYFENNSNYSIGLFNVLRSLENLKVLSIDTRSLITKESNLKDCDSIKDLTIHCNSGSYDPKKAYLEQSIEEFSLPQSVTKLKLLNFTMNKIPSNVIPNSVLSLTIDRIEIVELPPSLTYLKLYEKPAYYYTKEESLSLLSLLPKSLTKLTIPHYFQNFNLIYNDNIKKIKFR